MENLEWKKASDKLEEAIRQFELILLGIKVSHAKMKMEIKRRAPTDNVKAPSQRRIQDRGHTARTAARENSRAVVLFYIPPI